VFNIESRAREKGLLFALGFPVRLVKRLILLEGAILTLFGSLLGGIAGILYNQLILIMLKTIWSVLKRTGAH
jgi:ABC-type antimicrobial peptide transport system permease subunit